MTTTPVLPEGYELAAFETIDSTNAELKRRIGRHAGGDRLVVWSLEQTQGRGRRGRAWSGPSGNLMCSVLLWPQCTLAAASQLSFVAALAALDLVRASLPAERHLSLKWPNDVLVEGRKISGILLEAGGWMPGAPGWIVVGTGVNLCRHPVDTEWPATDIREEGGDAPDPAQALQGFCSAFEAWRARWTRDGFEPIRRQWLEHAHRLGEEIVARMDRDTVNGRFVGIDPDGSLVLKMDDGAERRIAAADIFPVAA